MDRQVYFSGGRSSIGTLTNPGGSLADGDYVAPFAVVVENGVVTRVEQAWVNDIDYTADSLVLGSDCQLYRAVQANGPSSTVQDPVTDVLSVYWRLFPLIEDIADLNFADRETPAGLVNSANTAYTLAHAPSPASSLKLFQNGQLLEPGGEDYSLLGGNITFVTAPETGDRLRAWYRY